MKILFLCAGLEAGRNGVGDYCRRLSAAGRDAGWAAALLAIHDRGVQTPTQEDAPIPLLRLPQEIPWDERHQHAAGFLTREHPDWVSLQFVGYGLAPRGIVFRWVPRLAALLAGRRVHLMFHELWIGAATEYGLRDRLIGFVQKRAIRQLVRRLRPAVVHTSNAAYQQLLAGIGVRAGRLPLPGNLPVAAGAGAVPGWPALDRTKCWVAGIFGSIHPQWQPEPWLDECIAHCRQAGRRLVLVQFGEAGAAGRAKWQRLETGYRDRIECVTLGPGEPEAISRTLAQLDFGIATSPWALIEKSGATAAFLDHGVPVLVTRDDWRLRTGFTPPPAGHPLLFRSAPALIRALPFRPVANDRTPGIARHLCRDLVAAQ